MGDLLRKDFDWSKQIPSIKPPVMLVVGDSDAIRTSHAVKFFELLGGGKKDGGWDGSGFHKSRIAVLPGLTNYNIFFSPVLFGTIMPFLDAPNLPTASMS